MWYIQKICISVTICKLTNLDFSTSAGTNYFTPSGEMISFRYICNENDLSLGPANQQLYEVQCYPDYYKNLKFFAPKNQDAATIFCKSNLGWFFGTTWAVPCNSVPECYLDDPDDPDDEIGCKFPAWLIPSLLSGAGAVLLITLFVYLYKSIKSSWKKKMHFQFRNLHLSIETEKLYRTAVLIESGNVEQIHKMYCQEVENHGGEGEALCYLKVMGYLI